MEPVTSGLTLENLYKTTQAKQQPIPEDLTFHMIDQMTKACDFLYTKCRIIRADVNRRNIMLRYPGREAPLMPDLVMIDWPLWEESSDELILKDTADV
jgi:RIO-like serine/threonine protein kinase